MTNTHSTQKEYPPLFLAFLALTWPVTAPLARVEWAIRRRSIRDLGIRHVPITFRGILWRMLTEAPTGALFVAGIWLRQGDDTIRSVLLVLCILAVGLRLTFLVMVGKTHSKHIVSLSVLNALVEAERRDLHRRLEKIVALTIWAEIVVIATHTLGFW